MSEILPVIFFAHGNPINAVLNNCYSQGWALIGEHTPKPKAILSISAHSFVLETGVTISTAPRTIHDFCGFRENYIRCNIPRPAILILPAGCKK
jgi:4,5-DOPA dioxygenase extradiol